jgi:AraC family transcriptional regulator of adaptative response/methylated-DNA-[protein]-cysteine methyltransferase
MQYQTQAALDYSRIERAICWLREHYREQPDLAAISRAVHTSEFHLQRLFTRWAGISPKRFLQALTIEHAKEQLARSASMLETALDAGLSGPGRLHDLFVSVEAVTPGEFRTRGAGITIEYGFHETPFGLCLIGVTARGICWLSFLEPKERKEALTELKQHWSGAMTVESQAETPEIVRQVVAGAQRTSGPGVLLMGTNFQLKVWKALLQIPAGTLASYESVGELAGARNAPRAVGAAVGANNISFLIPCHRVIRKTGALGGYRWGEPRKQAMLAWEAALSGQ